MCLGCRLGVQDSLNGLCSFLVTLIGQASHQGTPLFKKCGGQNQAGLPSAKHAMAQQVAMHDPVHPCTTADYRTNKRTKQKTKTEWSQAKDLPHAFMFAGKRTIKRRCKAVGSILSSSSSMVFCSEIPACFLAAICLCVSKYFSMFLVSIRTMLIVHPDHCESVLQSLRLILLQSPASHTWQLASFSAPGVGWCDKMTGARGTGNCFGLFECWR